MKHAKMGHRFRVDGMKRESHATEMATRRGSRELRLAITGRCTYACFFCHREGQQADHAAPAPASRSLALLRDECGNGVNDVTLTGGEPLLERGLVMDLVSGLAAFPEGIRPALTVVTNGSRWDSGVVDVMARYPGMRKVNVSLHGAEPDCYDRITGTRGQFGKVTGCIRSLVAAGIDVKLNVVVARGMNAESGDFRRMLTLAVELGVKGVKFLELMVPCGGKSGDPRFVGSEEIESRVVSLGYRRDCAIQRGVRLVPLSGTGPEVEIKSCSCSMGCGRCHEALARNFGPDLAWQPCFMGKAAVNEEIREVA